MKLKSAKGILFCAFLLFASIPSGFGAGADTDCTNCHKDLLKGKNVHPAVSMGCTRCHSGVDARKTPHKLNKKYPKGLLWSQPGLCYGCHDSAPFIKKHIHPAMADGQCRTCHNPHSSNNPFLLEQPETELCNNCHDGMGSGKHVLTGYGLGDAHPTGARKDPFRPGRELSCTSCHTPHSSLRPFQFTPAAEKKGNLCQLCHTKIMVKP